MRTIYLDYNATTPLDARVHAAMLPYLGPEFGNASSVHHLGRRARAALDEARDRVARVWRCKPTEVVFTSGGTESNNLAILGMARSHRNRRRHLITSPTEHHSVLECFQYLATNEGFSLSLLPVDHFGCIDPADLRSLLREDTLLVSVMAANNETGTLQSVSEMGALCRQRGVLFHTDAAQWFGKEPFTEIQQFGADLVTCCAHKLHGPKGAGVLYLRSGLSPQPILLGGSHENERRAGTENVSVIVGLAAALERFVPTPVFPKATLLPLKRELAKVTHMVPGVAIHGHPDRSLANTLALTSEGCQSMPLLAALDLEGVCASSGSACAAGSVIPSHVLLAMGVPPQQAASLVRFSLGHASTYEEIDYVRALFATLVSRVRNYA